MRIANTFTYIQLKLNRQQKTRTVRGNFQTCDCYFGRPLACTIQDALLHSLHMTGMTLLLNAEHGSSE
uniref:GM04363p n=1 Tax=Drosophila melanogaster TaxID=7227 RepID=Q8MRE1_DROME|nr:GM04363p [Drosophila melanogaster]